MCNENKMCIRDSPSPINPKPGCRFAARCRYATDACREATPELVEVKPDHFVAVSYTHLDVYKRQVLFNGIKSRRSSNVLCMA